MSTFSMKVSRIEIRFFLKPYFYLFFDLSAHDQHTSLTLFPYFYACHVNSNIKFR